MKKLVILIWFIPLKIFLRNGKVVEKVGVGIICQPHNQILSTKKGQAVLGDKDKHFS